MKFEVLEVAREMVRSAVPLLRKLVQVDRHLEDQLRRALVSVPSKIAEGNRRLGKDRIYLFSTAAGSADEAINHLQIAVALGYLSDGEISATAALADRVLAMLYRLGVGLAASGRRATGSRGR